MAQFQIVEIHLALHLALVFYVCVVLGVNIHIGWGPARAKGRRYTYTADTASRLTCSNTAQDANQPPSLPDMWLVTFWSGDDQLIRYKKVDHGGAQIDLEREKEWSQNIGEKNTPGNKQRFSRDPKKNCWRQAS